MAGRKKGGAKKPPLVLVGTNQARMRRASPSDWTKAKQSKFLTALADTCNVKHAAELAGVSFSNAYKRRKTDAAFRAAWLESVATAYHRLELVLLDRAFNGTEKVITRKDGSADRMLEYSNQLGLSLLRMHRDTAAEAEIELSEDHMQEVRQRLFNKLQRLRKRQARDAEEE